MKSRYLPLLLVCATACATGHPRLEARDFAHPSLAGVRLTSIEPIVVVGPSVATGDALTLDAFAPPSLDRPLDERPSGARTTQSNALLVREVAGALERSGFARCPNTSSTATIARGTLAEALDTSPCDAVLVVRAVPVTQFSIHEGAGMILRQTAMGRERVRDYRAVARTGFLLVGQAFLYDTKSKVRIWSRQAPDFPEDARLVPEHPFLAYGVVDRVDAAPDPSTPRVATAAFAARLLSSLPAPNRSDGLALDADAAGESSHTFLDEAHWVLSASGALGFDPFSADLTWFGEPLDAFGTGELAPTGRFSIAPTVGYQTAGGSLFELSVLWAQTRSAFSRTYHQDRIPTGAAPEHQTVDVSVGGGSGIGLELRYGRLTSPDLLSGASAFLVPSIGLSGERWDLDVRPSSVFSESIRYRIAATAKVEIWLRPGSGPVFLRGGAEGRIGLDTTTGLIGGVCGILGAGVFL